VGEKKTQSQKGRRTLLGPQTVVRRRNSVTVPEASYSVSGSKAIPQSALNPRSLINDDVGGGTRALEAACLLSRSTKPSWARRSAPHAAWSAPR